MPYDVYGNFTRDYNWVNDRNNNITIQATRMDGEFDNFATAMDQVMLRSGVTPYTGNILMGGNMVTGIGGGSAANPSITSLGDNQTGLWFPSTGQMSFAAGGVETGRLTATGMGIGTTAPRTALDVAAIASFRGAFEDATITATAASGVEEIDYLTSAVKVYTALATANFSFDVRGDGTHTLNSIMGVGQMCTMAIEVPQGTTAYYCTAITIDGVAPASIHWAGGYGAPTAGNPDGNDVYLIRVIKTASTPTYAVRASVTQES